MQKLIGYGHGGEGRCDERAYRQASDDGLRALEQHHIYDR
jgi:hypothetical protein